MKIKRAKLILVKVLGTTLSKTEKQLTVWIIIFQEGFNSLLDIFDTGCIKMIKKFNTVILDI